MAWKKVFFWVFAIFFISTGNILAQEKLQCENRYLALINPVRGRNLWFDKTLKPLEDQYEIITKYNFSATWLLQYDALIDKEIIKYIKDNFSKDQEIGLFLEISPDLAGFARVIYPPLIPWDDPKVIFLSGYSQSERRRLIDALFKRFYEVFGRYPSSVGAWWIDSYSLEYMKGKYGVKTVLIVADQKTTDDYGVWGQWWGVPYYPALANVLIPAQRDETKLDVVVLQWAQRDITKADGEGPVYSNYSLQANDYPERGFDTSYFKKLVKSYLDCGLPVGQITVGLETGIESVKSFPEYRNQIKALSELEGLKSVTMDRFSNDYRNIFYSNPEKLILKDDESEWILTPENRENSYLKEKITYQNNLSFTDYFIPDKSDFLNRRLPINHKEDSFFSPLFVLLAFVLGFIVYFRLKLTKNYWFVSLFIIASFLTTFLSYSKFGHSVNFGAALKNISITQFFIVIISYLFFIPFLMFFTKKIKNISLLMLSLSFSFTVDFVIGILRYTQLQGEHYFGFSMDALRFIGFRVSPKSLSIVNQDFSSLIAGSLLKFDFNLIWESKIISLVVYPLFHIVLGMFIYFWLIKLPKKLRKIVIIIMFVFFCLYLFKTITLDPRVVF